MLQDLVVFTIVAAAITFLVRNMMLSARGKKGCGCGAGGGCAKATGRPTAAPLNNNLIQIQLGDGRKLVENQPPTGREL